LRKKVIEMSAQRVYASVESLAPYNAALAEMRSDAPDVARAAALLRVAVKRGDAMAAYALATWYIFGQEPAISRDPKQGAILLRRAVKGGIVPAMHDLAVCYETGCGTPKAPRMAFDLYLAAALRGDAASVFSVGRCLYYGIGIARDRRTAKVWFDRSEELGVYDSLESEPAESEAHS
jgi:TPR repeat protein